MCVCIQYVSLFRTLRQRWENGRSSKLFGSILQRTFRALYDGFNALNIAEES